MTSVQSATASTSVSVRFAFWTRPSAPTADLISDNISGQRGSHGATTVRSERPKLAMARAAAPMLSGLRGETRMTSSELRLISMGKEPF